MKNCPSSTVGEFTKDDKTTMLQKAEEVKNIIKNKSNIAAADKAAV